MRFSLPLSFESYRSGWGLALCLMTGALNAATIEESTEDGFLDELPVVLSVTRLAQSLADTPGAVTIIDRDMIRRSGAREVAEVLRLVPGFIVSYASNGSNPTASYHALLDDYARRMQVFVDGRSVYSTLFIGDTHRGLMGVVLEDIERIEVLRGSNSAAYGSNAFLGVINIITRNSADTRGGMASVTMGDQGVNDHVVRYGWGNDTANFRLTSARRKDAGLTLLDSAHRNDYDDKTVSQLHLRGDLRPSNQDEVMVNAGYNYFSAGLGRAGETYNRQRNEDMESYYAQVRWARQLSPTESLSFSATLDDEQYSDAVPVPTPTLPRVNVMFGHAGKAQRKLIEVTHTNQLSDTVRTVWGGNWRHEWVQGPLLFNTNDKLSQAQMRWFGNLEWRIANDWLINAGGLYEKNQLVKDNFAPRLMLNYTLLPQHTLRIGTTKAQRTPTLFEMRADESIRHPTTGVLQAAKYLSRGNVRSETVSSRELGYFGDFREQNLTLDVRMYREKLRDMVTAVTYTIAAADPSASDFVNNLDMDVKGIEQQWRWKPFADTQLLFNHAYTRIESATIAYQLHAPRVSYSAALFQKLPKNMDFSLMYSRMSEMSWNSPDDRLPTIGIVDARLAYPFKVGATRMEFAVTGQSINGSHLDYKKSVLVGRRTFATLRMDF